MSPSLFVRLIVSAGVVVLVSALILRWRQPTLTDGAGRGERLDRPVPDTAPMMTAPPAGQPPVLADIRRERQDVRWAAPVSEPAAAGFREWTRAFARAAGSEAKDALRPEGRLRAEARRHELADLIEKDPRRALELAVPHSVRRALPPEIVDLLEEPVSAMGDLDVAALLPMPGQERWVRPVERTVTLADGRVFDAYTYGRRAEAPSRRAIAIHGIALDGKLAFSDSPGRILEPVEVAGVRAGLTADPLCPTSGMAPAPEDEVVVDWAGREPTFFCGPKHAADMLLAAQDEEAAQLPPIAALGFGTAEGLAPVAESGWTEGTKKMLIIRVDFPDKTGQVVSDATLTTLINNMAAQWTAMSYGKTTWSALGAGSAFTPTLRLPNGHASYTSFGTMLSAARAAAEDAGYDYRDYNFEVVVTGDKPDVGFGGVAFVGARGAWLANGQWNLGVCTHEVGHNFGLNHAGFWDTTDGTTIGAGSNVEYGNPFDQMGGASSSTSAHYGARQKNYLDWIPDADVVKVSAAGTTTTRLSAHDRQGASGKRALAIDRSNTTNDYWVEARQNYTSNKWMKDGVILNWGPFAISNAKPMLLDVTPSTSSKDDVPLLLGRTFSEPAQGIHITPVAKGADPAGVTWFDVTVNKGTFAGNLKPVVTVSATNANPATNASVTFTATASDPNGDALAYFWDWGDGTFTANNAATAGHSFTSTGTKTVRCIVSDMKGLTATGQMLVQVGSSTTFFVQGVVKTSAGAPVEGAVVTAGTASDTTDSEGYFAITGLASGSYTVTPAKAGLTFQPSGFTNPVSVGPSRQNVNFTAPPGVPTFGTLRPSLVDAGSNTGTVFLPLSDPDTPLASLTLTASSANQALVPDSGIAFGTAGAFRTVTATAPANVSGVVTITLTASDAQGGTSNAAWSVTVNNKPSVVSVAQSTPENSPRDVDLNTFVTDDWTPPGQWRFDVGQARNGTVQILPDGHTARFMPRPDFNGAASFVFGVRDRSLSSRTLLLWTFEPPDASADGRVDDGSNHARTGTFDVAGSGGEYAYGPDVPAPLSPHSQQSLALTQGDAGSARVFRTISTDELSFNDEDWSLTLWLKRQSRDTDDIALHLGEGAGFVSKEALLLFLPAAGDALTLRKYGTAGLQKEIVGPALPVGEWHHVAVTYDRTAASTGTLSLYVDGYLQGSATGVAMGLSQSFPFVLGGAQDDTTGLTRWFDGRFDDVMLADSVLSRASLRVLAEMSAPHELGLANSATVGVTVTGTNQPPVMAPVADVGLAPGTSSGPLAIRLSDAESEARTLTLSASSSDPLLFPSSGITVSGPPPAWTSGDIGSVGAAGSTVEDHGTFVVRASGAGLGGATDEFRFVRQAVTGDVEIVARIAALDVTNDLTRAGVMLRDGVAADAAFAAVSVTGAQGVLFESRGTAAASASVAASANAVSAPCWVRLVRSGGTVSAWFAPDDGTSANVWQPLGSPLALSFAGTAHTAGLAVTSRADGTLATAVFDSVGGTLPAGGDRTLTLVPAAGRAGIATLTLTAGDGAATSSRTFRAVVGVNTPPEVSQPDDVTVVDGTQPATFALNVSDLHTPATSLAVNAVSSNGTLLPAPRIALSGSGASRTVTLRPIPGETGTATVTLSVGDGQETTTRTFVLTVTPGDPAVFVPAGANWRYWDASPAPAAWQSTAFDHSTWPFGPAQLGFGDGDEATLVTANAARILTCFRRTFTVANRFDWAQLRLRLLRDDGAVIHLNGVEIARSNMPAGPVTASTLASTAVGNTAESAFFPIVVNNPPLVDGTNVLAVSIHQSATTSSDLGFDLEVIGGNPEPLMPVAAGSTWRYLDTGVAPDPTWKDPGFTVPAAWGTGDAPLGYGDGDEVTVIAGAAVSPRPTTSWFRREFTLDNPAAVQSAFVRYVRDDGLVLHLNGTEIVRDNLPAGAITAATFASAGVSGADESRWFVRAFDPALLRPGANVLAAEIHQASATSTDVSFDLATVLHTHDSVPQIACTCTPSTLTLTWPKWAADWSLQQSPDLTNWSAAAAAPTVIPSATTITLPRPPGPRYYRLVAP